MLQAARRRQQAPMSRPRVSPYGPHPPLRVARYYGASLPMLIAVGVNVSDGRQLYVDRG